MSSPNDEISKAAGGDPEALPLVSVIVIAYNHERYIRQSVQSILDQVRSFPIEIVISDDGSSDATRSIVKQLVVEYPDIVRDVSSGKRLGIGGNFHHAYRNCRGEFIALLDSDDYWLSRDKLAKQIELLRNDPGCMLCYHNAILLMEATGEARVKVPAPVEDIADAAYFFARNPITTATVMFRNVFTAAETEALIGLTIQDLPLWILLAERGTVRCLPELFAVYRMHAGGTYSRMSATEALLARRKSLTAIRRLVSAKTGFALDRRLVQMHLELFLRRTLLNRQFGSAANEWQEARKVARSIGMGPAGFVAQLFQAVRLAASAAFGKIGSLVGSSPSAL